MVFNPPQITGPVQISIPKKYIIVIAIKKNMTRILIRARASKLHVFVAWWWYLVYTKYFFIFFLGGGRGIKTSGLGTMVVQWSTKYIYYIWCRNCFKL